MFIITTSGTRQPIIEYSFLCHVFRARRRKENPINQKKLIRVLRGLFSLVAPQKISSGSINTGLARKPCGFGHPFGYEFAASESS
jgi:hypothetical protein